jgi:hypothetical protein
VTCDWRDTEPDKLAHVPDKLPIDYLNKLHQMLDEFGLNFGEFDIIRDGDDTIYFIEGIGSKFSLKCLWFAQWWNSSKI